MMPRNLWGSSTPGWQYYGDGSTITTEPNMREEFIHTMDGFYPEVAKKQTGLLRRMRRTTNNGLLIACGCVDSFTQEPDKDRWCPVCMGEGVLFDEELVTFYKTLEARPVANALRDTQIDPGLLNIPLVVFYIRYSAAITKDDKLIEITLDDNGDPVSPYVRRALYRIGTAWEYRSDNGKLEYFKVFTYREERKYLNAPSFEELE